MEKKIKVLIVDDEVQNLRLMEAMLIPQGYEVIKAYDGEEAIEKANETHPDVILLDIMMPKMNGYNACRNLKKNAGTAHVPILLVTSLKDRTERLKGFEAGANDFLSKPIDKHDLILRVRNASYTKGLFDLLQKNYDKLKELETLRDNLTHMIVHDLRSPLSGISGTLQLLQSIAKDTLGEKPKHYLDMAFNSVLKMTEMVNSLLDINRLEEGKMKLNLDRCDLGNLGKEAIDMLGALENKSTIHFEPPDESISVICDTDLIRRVLVNLLGNAVKFGDKIDLTIGMEGNRVRISVIDNGRGIPSEYHKKIFEKFGQVEIRKEGKMYSTGLGLTFCKLAIEAHGGEIGVISEPGQGSTFWFVLPVEKESEKE